MKTSWKIGRVAGIDLFLHPTFLLLLAWIAASDGLARLTLIVAVFACVMLHEFGHAFAARLFGIATRDITLYPIGGVARLDRMPRAPGAEMLIALAGPAVNVAIAGILGLALWQAGFWQEWGVESASSHFAASLLAVNLFLALFNLIPAFPMDGGRVLRALLAAPFGRLRATEIAATVGKFAAFSIPLGGFWLSGSPDFMLVVLAIFVYWAGGSELAQVRREEALRTGGGDPGVWVAPAGHRWVHVGGGAWQLCPISMNRSPREGGRWI